MGSSKESERVGDFDFGVALGGTFACKNAQKTLEELGITSNGGDGVPRLSLATFGITSKYSVRRCCSPWTICCKRGRKRRGCCSSFCMWLWWLMPHSCQEKLQPY